MPTDAQNDANRSNALNSTGPRTEDGKARSSMNALKTGIYSTAMVIHGENAADLDALSAQFNQSCLPATPQEQAQVDILIRCAWRARRLDRAEAQTWNYTIDESPRPTLPTALGKAFYQRAPTLQRLDRMVDANDRRFRQANAELDRLQSERRKREAAAAPAALQAAQPAAADPPTTCPEIGFVPSTPDPAPSPLTPGKLPAARIGFVRVDPPVPSPRNGGRR